MIVTVAAVADFGQFLHTFQTRGAETRREHGCRGARVFRDPFDRQGTRAPGRAVARPHSLTAWYTVVQKSWMSRGESAVDMPTWVSRMPMTWLAGSA